MNTTINKKWWNSLSEAWKDEFLYNIAFLKAPFEEYDFRLALGMEKSTYEMYYGKEYKRPKTYDLNQVLDRLRNIKQFIITDGEIKDLEPLEALNQLIVLDISTGTVNLDKIGALNQLQRLFISNNNMDLQALENLKQLHYLNLTHNKNSLKPLSQLPNLKKLVLASESQDLSTIKNIKNLEVLTIHPIKGEARLEQISGLKSLKELIITNSFHEDLNFLSSMKNLKYLSIGYNTQDLTPIGGLKQLESLDIISNKQPLDILLELKNLRKLNLSYNNVKLDVVGQLTQLESLILNMNMQKLKPICSLKNLKYLRGQHTGYKLPCIEQLVNTINKNGGDANIFDPMLVDETGNNILYEYFDDNDV